mmetsp:Transcript_4687/g.10022  ORF Transcript_4687/g.10022 Transcript_4687/m.10022 type:complete len:98 (-) Transcript_4687:225-518(-)
MAEIGVEMNETVRVGGEDQVHVEILNEVSSECLLARTVSGQFDSSTRRSRPRVRVEPENNVSRRERGYAPSPRGRRSSLRFNYPLEPDQSGEKNEDN